MSGGGHAGLRMYREGVRGQTDRDTEERAAEPSERERRPRYRVTARLDARAHRMKHRSRATVRARSSMEKSARVICFSIIRPAAVPDRVRSTGGTRLAPRTGSTSYHV